MKELKYKVGDKVRIKSLEWYNQMLSIPSKIVGKGDFVSIECGLHIFTKEMCKFCGRVMTIQEIGIDFYLMEEDMLGYEFTDEMIEGLVEEETKFGTSSNPIEPKSNANCLTQERVNELKSCTNINDVNNDAIIVPTCVIVEMVKELGVSCPEGYEFRDENGNVINAQKIVLEKKKKEYPKTFVEVLDFWYPDRQLGDDYQSSHKKDLIENFQDLLYARDAYWKIAGEEMGLGRPWEYDCNSEYFTPAIIYRNGYIQKVSVQYRNAVLSFPTEEMRDVFYEAFKKLIEECKELL